MTQKAIFVIGMHRSGTSAATGALRLLGVDLAKTYEAQKGVNDRGFWEHADLVDTHDSVLRLLGSSWDDILPIESSQLEAIRSHKVVERLLTLVKRDFRDSKIWGFKDPRICRLLPIWFHLEGKGGFSVRCWLVTRNPAEVAASLARRNEFSIEKSMLLWLSHTLLAEQATRGRMRTHSTYDDLLANPIDTFEQVDTDLDLNLHAKLHENESAVRGFLTSDLRHHKQEAGPSESSERSFTALAVRAYDILRTEKGQISGSACLTLDQIKIEFDELIEQMNPVAVEHLKAVSAARGKYERYFFEAYHSFWWKLSTPVRAIEKLVRKS